MRLLFVSGLSSLVVLWACGGDVRVDGPPTGAGSGGGTATGSGAAATSGTGAAPAGPSSGSGAASTSSSNGSATGGGAPSAACGSACAAIGGCIGFDCNTGCANANGNCAFAFEPFLECVAAQTDPATCDLPDACVGLLQSYLDCESWCIDEFGCFEGSDGECGCSVDGACGPVGSYETFCSPIGNGSLACDCLAGGQVIGTCTDDGSGACDPTAGCCGALFFVPASSFF